MAGLRLPLPLFTELRFVEKIHSPKFAVASDTSGAASTRQLHGGTPSASKRGD
jgi:hypothetical protein